MIIKLISLSLNNFKGIDYFEFLPDGKSSSVFGTNASGKTTLADAYFWLLFGKDSSGAANFDVKTIGTSGLDYSVTAKIEIDGKFHILTRTLSEKWERKHGETEKRLKGNTTTYEIDGVPVKEKDFKAFIENELINEKTYQMLTDPDFFAGKTDWKKRRSQLIEWFADVSDEDIISSHSEFKELSEILDGKTIENAQKSIQASRKAVNDLLKAIPNRIDEQQRNINEITSAINGDEQENLDRLLKEKTTVENDIIKASTSESLNRAKAAVEEIKLKIVRARKAYEESNNADRSTEQQILTLRKEKFKLQSKAADNNQNLKLLEKRLSDITDQGKGYNEEFKRISAQEYEESNICPCCGQLLPRERVQAAIREFNLHQSEKLEKIKSNCIKLKSERSEIKEKIAGCLSLDTSLSRQIDTFDTSIEKLEISMKKPVPFEKTKEYEHLSMKLLNAEEIVKTEEIRFKQNTEEKISEYRKRIKEIENQCSDIRIIIANQNTLSMYRERIEELKKQEKEYGLLLAKTDKELMMIDEFVKVKCSEVENMINSHFGIVKWKLFDLQVNGGINDCCEATVNGVDYSTNLNSAAKLNAGLDIINTISEVTNTYVPIWIDNAESVVNYIETQSQTIKLVVSEKYKQLTVKE